MSLDRLAEIQQKIVEKVRQGHTIRAAAGSQGVTLGTVREWVHQGSQGNILHSWLFENLEGAEWDGRCRLERVVLDKALGNNGDDPDPKAAMLALTKFHWEHYDAQAILQRETNLGALRDADLRAKIVEFVKHNQELRADVVAALKEEPGGLQRDEGPAHSAAGDAECGVRPGDER